MLYRIRRMPLCCVFLLSNMSIAFGDDAPPDRSAPNKMFLENELEAQNIGINLAKHPRAAARDFVERGPMGGTWVPQGPAPANNGQTEGPSKLAVDGAIQTVLAHPTNPNILWIGAVNGGIWKTTNATAAPPTWTPLTDSMTSLSIGALELDSTDGTFNTLIAGNGRKSSFGGIGGPGTEVFRSVDGGTTWVSINHPLLSPENCSGIAERGAVMLFASVSPGGMFRSPDTGVTWTKLGLAAGLPSFYGVYDLVASKVNNARFYCVVAGTGIFRSTNSGATWTNISDAAQSNVFATFEDNNSELATAVNGRLYAAIITNGQLQYIAYTDDPDANPVVWTRMDIPSIPATGAASKTVIGATNTTPITVTTSGAHGYGTGMYVEIKNANGNTAANGIFTITVTSSTQFRLNFSSGNGVFSGTAQATEVVSPNPEYEPGGQGSIHFSIVADVSNPNLVYVGGDRQDGPFPNFISATDYSGNLWRGNTAIAPNGRSPSAQWAHLTHSHSIAAIPTGGTANGTAPHADSREMAIDANGELIETDDGGVFRRTSPQTNTGDWFSLNGNLQVTEQHDIIFDTVSNVVVSGNQDTGTTTQLTPGGMVWNSTRTADGGDVAVDTVSAAPNSIRYVSFQDLDGFSRITYSPSNTGMGVVFPPLTGSGGWSPDFVSTIEVNAVNPAHLIISGFGILESLDRGDTATFLDTGDYINERCLAYGAVGSPDAIYAAIGNTVLVRLFGAGTPAPTVTPYPGQTPRDLVIDPNDGTRLYVAGSNSGVPSVYVTPDAGNTWTDLTGNLPTVSVLSIEYISGTTSYIAVGAYSGVFVMNTAVPGVWSRLGAGMPNVLVFDLDYDRADDVLVAGTMGRGAWKLTNVNPNTSFSVSNAALNASGPIGGPFTPPCQAFTVQNNTGLSINWSASVDDFWAAPSPSSGSLAPGDSTSVNVCTTPLAVYAAPGALSDVITFSDTTNGINVQRSAVLTVAPQTLASFNMSTNPGWTTQGQWQYGAPLGMGSENHDPTAGVTGANVYGYNLSGDYPNNLSPQALTTTALNFSNASKVTLTFYRWLGVEDSIFDSAAIQVSNDGSTWSDVWVHNGPTIADTNWTKVSYDISGVAGNHANVFVRWIMGGSDSIVTLPGWNIDDVTFTGGTFKMASVVWADFGFQGTELGTQPQPFNTLVEAVTSVNPLGTVNIKGDSADTTIGGAITVSKPMTIHAVNGSVRLGAP